MTVHEEVLEPAINDLLSLAVKRMVYGRGPAKIAVGLAALHDLTEVSQRVLYGEAVDRLIAMQLRLQMLPIVKLDLQHRLGLVIVFLRAKSPANEPVPAAI